MAAVTQVIPNFLGGVSRQTDQKKLPGQVRDCLNAYPDPTFGLMKRPGFKFIKTIYEPSSGTDPELKDGKWFFIKRSEDEIYIGCILDVDDSDHSTYPIRIWNKTGDDLKENITYEGEGTTKNYLNTTHDNYDILTVQDTSIITNKEQVCNTSSANPTGYVPGSFGTVRLLNIAYSNRYMLKVKVPSVHSTNFHGTDYSSSIKRVGNSENLVDSDRTEGNYLGISASSATYVNDENNNARTSVEEAAKFNVTVNAAGGTTVSLVDRGKGYLPGDKFTFTSAVLGGSTGVKELSIKSGETGTGRTAGTYQVGPLSGDSGSGSGVHVTVYIGTDGSSTAMVSLREGGSGFQNGDEITIDSSELSQIGSTSLVLKVDAIKDPADLVTEVLEVNDDVTDLIAAQYYTINAEDNTPSNQESNPSDEKYLTANRILTQLEAGLKATTISGHTWHITKLDSTLEVQIKDASGNPVKFELTASDSQGNFSIEAFNEEVASVADLPKQTTHGRIVKVVNSGPAETTYWTKFTAENGDSGKGYWEESINPIISEGLDKSTMPHELHNSSPNNFIFRQANWTPRNIGDEVTNPDPGFVSKTIQQCFYHNNRLGILTEDNVVMSKTSDFFNFYYTSALTITDNDPIDINCSSLRPAVLHGVIPTAQGLILFSQNQQFIMFADAEVLTPASAVIRGIANYEMDPKIDPVESGTLINFVSKTPSSTRVFSVQTRGSDDSPDILDIGKIVSGWIPQTTKNLISSPANSLIALYGDNTGAGSPTIYIYKTYTVGEKMVMQAWVKWDLPGNIQHVSIDNDVMYAVVETTQFLDDNSTDKGKYVLCSTNLTEAPEETILTTADGQKVNPYMDLYTAATNGLTGENEKTVTYDSDGNFSKCYIPYADLTKLNPVILIAGNATDNFAGVRESGFTINPTRATDSDGTYFKIPGKDLSTQAANVYVGYQYNYDIELPKTYFKLNPEGTQYDYTAALTVARMKFALGLSSVCSFKVKSKGYRGEITEFTGDGSTTAFSVPFLLKEENGIKVTLDGARQDPDDFEVARTVINDVTIDNSDTVTFDTPPTGITAKQLYSGTGYSQAYNVATTGGSGTGLTVDHFIDGYGKVATDQVGTKITDKAMSSTSPYHGQSDADAQMYNYCWRGFNVGSAPTTDSPYFCLDVDGDGVVSPVDAIILVRYMVGPLFAGDALTNGMLFGDNATRTSATAIRAFIDGHVAGTTIDRETYDPPDGSTDVVVGNKNVYDIDADGQLTQLGDALLAVRIFGGYDSNTGVASETSVFLNPHDGGPATWDGTNWVLGTPTVFTRDQGSGYKPNDVITIVRGDANPDDATFLIDKLGDKIAITTDTWYDVQPSSDAGQYLADDVPLVEENIFTIPLHQRSENFNLRVFSNSPFPVSLTSMMWEGQYSPRFYRRT